jgi:3-methyladenine DNA glycosylase Mpg
MYDCMNITTMEEGIPQAVLLRQVVAADEESKERMIQLRMARKSARVRMREKRDILSPVESSSHTNRLQTPDSYHISSSILKHLSDGPGKLCMAMGISRQQNDIDMVNSSDFYITNGVVVEPSQIQSGKRIGIDYAEEAAEYLWRFWI